MSTFLRRSCTKNKRGVSFAVGILLVTIVVAVYAVYSAATLSQKRAQELASPINLLNAQAEAREAGFYLEKAGALSAQQASYELLNAVPTQGTCDKLSSGEVLFGGDCRLAPADVLEKEFLAKFQKKFSSYLESYESTFKTLPGQAAPPASAFSGVITIQSKDNFGFDLQDEEIKVVAKEKVTYALPPATYKVDFSFSAQALFSMEELSQMIEKSEKATKECKSSTDVATCALAKVSSENLEFSAEKRGNILIFTARTKERAFFSDGGYNFDRIFFGYAFSI